MRREYSEQINEQILIFDAPLTQGDTTDHISGVSPTILSATMSWNSTYSMYQFTKNGAGSISWRGLSLDLGFTSTTYSNVNCIIEYDIIISSSSNTTYPGFPCLGRGNIGMSSYGERGFSTWEYKLIQEGFSISRSTLYHFKNTITNGVALININGSDYSSLTLYIDTNPSGTGNLLLYNQAVNVCSGNWSGNNGTLLVKNIKVYRI